MLRQFSVIVRVGAHVLNALAEVSCEYAVFFARARSLKGCSGHHIEFTLHTKFARFKGRCIFHGKPVIEYVVEVHGRIISGKRLDRRGIKCLKIDRIGIEVFVAVLRHARLIDGRAGPAAIEPDDHFPLDFAQRSGELFHAHRFCVSLFVHKRELARIFAALGRIAVRTDVEDRHIVFLGIAEGLRDGIEDLLL